MTHVVERCPSCGVEHDVSVAGACEACHEPLRYWCRRHGRDAGWLAGPACPRCAEEAARPRPAATRSAGAAQPGSRPPLVRGVEHVPGRTLRERPAESPVEGAWKGPGTGGSSADIAWLVVMCVIVGAVLGVIVGSDWNARAGTAGAPLLGGLLGAGVGLLVAGFVFVVILVSRVGE
jgi:hypothetical protein